jgi:hypothetical protein
MVGTCRRLVHFYWFFGVFCCRVRNFYYLCSMRTAFTDFERVMKVLESSTTQAHFNTCERLFDNFKNMWLFKIDSVEMMSYSYEFYTLLGKMSNDHKFYTP